ncbi:hypothetical protein BCAR13_540056 [Paraburkholderia caribensis]|nr:hypothetical protein BCAR13_540056 [Paraburkholderia caribensis]
MVNVVVGLKFSQGAFNSLNSHVCALTP